MRVLNQIGAYLWARKIWWLTPMLIVAVLFGTLVFLSQRSTVAPFTYVLY